MTEWIEKRWTKADFLGMPIGQFYVTDQALRLRLYGFLGVHNYTALKVFTDPVTEDIVLRYRPAVNSLSNSKKNKKDSS